MLALAGLVLGSSAWVFPNFASAEIHWNDGTVENDPWPWIVGREGGEGSFSVTTQLHLPPVFPRRFMVVADDQLRGVAVNGLRVEPARFPILFDQFHPASLDLGGVLRPGPNAIRFNLVNGSGPAGLRIHVHPLDPLCISWTIALLICVGTGFLALARKFPETLGGAPGWILFAGISLRVLYFVATPYYLRAHDLGGHIEYFKYLAEHLAIPAADYGWETHQPPIYYFLGGLWMRFSGQSSSSWLYGQWTALSLILSVASLLIAGAVAARLFPSPNLTSVRLSFLAILAVFPALVSQSARISNDVLFAFLSFLWVWLLLRWWKKPSGKRWIALSIITGLGFLVKNGALVLAAIALLCALLRLRHPGAFLWRSAALGAITLLIAGWFQIPLALTAASPSSFVVGNIHRLDASLRIPGRMGDLLVLDPFATFVEPFSPAYSDSVRRAYFLEYYFKTALFGEWPWGSHLLVPARILVVASFGVVLLGLAGIWVAARQNYPPLVPLLILSAGMVGAQVAYVLKEPFSCNQDFRFFVATTIPFAAFAALGVSRLRWGRVIVILFCVASAGFLLPLLYA